jgi:hypothetical protein
MSGDHDRLLLGLGEEVEIREPTKGEHATLGLRTGDLVVEYRHPDREPDIFQALGVVLAPRSYGVRLPDGGPQEEM